MTDRLTPPMLRDLAEIDERIFGETPWSRALRREAARREAEAKPQNGRGHIPLITCPGSTKSCMGYDCLDKGCLDGEPMASGGVSVPELRNSNISLGGCEVCTTPTACKQEKHCDHFDCEWTRAVPDDELGRASGETGPSPSPVTTGLPPQGEREGPGSAATTPFPKYVGPDKEFAKFWNRPEDKPAPADDLPKVGSDYAIDLQRLIETLCHGATVLPAPLTTARHHRQMVERRMAEYAAQAREIAELKRLANSRLEFANQYAAQLGDAEARVRELEAELAAERDSRQIAQDTCDMQKARADGLADAMERAKVIIGARLDGLPAVRREAEVNAAWHILNHALTEGGA